MTDKIYLRVIQDDEKVKVVDQDGREVALVNFVSSTHQVGDGDGGISTATITFEQSKGPMNVMVNGFYQR